MEVNEAQKKAIDFYEGSCMVLAGPGSGKTTVITYRTKNLIEKYGVNPENILVITFTRMAALEMKERFNAITGEKNYPVSFGTFHAVYFKILKYAYNYNADNILKEDVKYGIIRDIVENMELEIDDENDFISSIIGEISLVKGEMLSIDNYYSKNCAEDIFRKIFKKYNNILLRKNVVDFDDMLVMCYELLDKRPDILKLWQEKFRFILVDEFQDINKVQYMVLKLLAKQSGNIFIVGDDDQSIYRFRGARPEIMLDFPKNFQNVTKINLGINYRCTGNIVKAAGEIINNNTKRFDKQITTPNDMGEPVIVREHKNNIEESISVLQVIDRHIKSGGKFGDIAILYRTSGNSTHLVGKLMEYNIPFKIKDTIPNIYEHFVSKDIISYIKAAMGSTDRKYFLQIINKPKRYISRQAFGTPNVSIEDLKYAYRDKSYILDRIVRLEYDLKMLSKMRPYAAINYIRHGIGYEEYIKEYAEYRHIKSEDLYDILDELTEDAKSYKTYDEWFGHMEKYAEELKRQMREKQKDGDSVTLSTMHSSKGMEYDTVIIIDANEGVIPHKKALLQSDIEEERRLFYVAVTRARRKLYVFHCKERFGKELEISRFVNELQSLS